MKEAVVDQVEMSEPGAEYSRVDRVTASLFSAIKKGATLKDLHGIPQATMQGIYAYAYKFYRQGELDKAESFFRFLCMYDFSCAEYHLGLGAVYQLKGEYGRAIEYYGVARSLASQDYRSVLHPVSVICVWATLLRLASVLRASRKNRACRVWSRLPRRVSVRWMI